MEKYAIKNNGVVYKIIAGEEEVLNRIKKSQLRKIEQKLIALNYQTISLDEVGNMTYFIEVKSTLAGHTQWNTTASTSPIYTIISAL